MIRYADRQRQTERQVTRKADIYIYKERLDKTDTITQKKDSKIAWHDQKNRKNKKVLII